MKTTVHKLVYLLINRLDKAQDFLSKEEFSLILETTPDLKRHLCEEYIEMPTLDKTAVGKMKPGMLLVPAINLVMMAARKKEITDYLFTQLREFIEPFKEVYYVQEKERHLVHGMDLFDIGKKSIEETRIAQPLNITNINQLFTCLHRSERGLNYFDLQPFHFDNHVRFDVGFETLFINNRNYQEGMVDKRVVQFNSALNLNVYLKNEFTIELRNINQALPRQLEKCFTLIKHHLTKGKKSFDWDEDTLSSLLSYPNAMLEKCSNDIVAIMVQASREQVAITPELLSLLFVKNKQAYTDFTAFMAAEGISMHEPPQEGAPVISPVKKDAFTLQLDKLKSLLAPHKETDSPVFTLCSEILQNAEFFACEKGLVFLAENIDTKLNIEAIFYQYIPRVLESYFNVPVHVRNDKHRDFLQMTLAQLEKINDQVKSLEHDILEEEMKKMKTFGIFLDNKFSSSGLSF